MTRSSRMSWLQQRFRADSLFPFLPASRLILFFFFLTLPLIIISCFGRGWIVFLISVPGLFMLSLVDLMLLPKQRDFSCKRHIPKETERGLTFQIRYLLTCQTKNRLIKFRLRDCLPVGFIDRFPLFGETAFPSTLELTCDSVAQVRGNHILDKVYFRYRSSLGLWEKQIIFHISDQISVIPNMDSVRSNLESMQIMLLEEGLKTKKNRLGSGEFAQVRNYVVGDDPRMINWRQSAKTAELMTNVYEPEHGKNITILIDCGRVMGVELSTGNRLEKALEAALTVAAAALKQGDQVSVLAFSNQVKKYIPLGKGLNHLRTIIKAVYTVQSDSLESNYGAAFYHLETVQKRQSFLLLFSDLDPFLNTGIPFSHINRIRRKHPLLILGISDPQLKEWVGSDPKDSRQAMIISMAQKELLQKKQEIRRLDKIGIKAMEVPEEKLATEAISQYADIINRGVL